MHHVPDCQCAFCQREKEVGREKALDEIRAWEQNCLERVGWYIHYILDDPHVVSNANIHTHGISDKFPGQLDLQLVFPLPQNIALRILNTIGENIREGKRYKHGDLADDVLKGFNVKFIDATENGRAVLRVILPDPVGNLEETDMHEPYSSQYFQESTFVPGQN